MRNRSFTRRDPGSHAVHVYIEVKTSAWHSKDAFEVSPAELRWAQHHGPGYIVGALPWMLECGHHLASKGAFEVSPAELRWAQHHVPAYILRTLECLNKCRHHLNGADIMRILECFNECRHRLHGAQYQPCHDQVLEDL